MDTSKLNSVEKDLVEGLEGFLTDLKDGKEIEKKYTVRRVILNLEPQVYSAAQVKATRQILKASQVLFAQFLGVSVQTVRAWEHGKTPSDMACRFMDEIQRHPEHWKRRLRESVTVKTATRA